MHPKMQSLADFLPDQTSNHEGIVPSTILTKKDLLFLVLYSPVFENQDSLTAFPVYSYGK
jgi:hypothetical protein